MISTIQHNSKATARFGFLKNIIAGLLLLAVQQLQAQSAGLPVQEGMALAQVGATKADRMMNTLPAGLTKGEITPKQQAAAESALKKQAAVLRFEQNAGQFPEPGLLFRAMDAQATYFFMKNEIRTVVRGKKDSLQAGYALQFVDANPGVAVKAADRFDAKSGATNYINDNGSFANVAAYSQLNYSRLWQGVDASFYESEGSMKYDFIVQPHADPTQVRLKMDGVTNLKINNKGELEFTTPFGTLQKGKPYTYQTVNGKQVAVAAAYMLKDGEISFHLGDYDHSLPLIIDPIALKWSTYLMQGIDRLNCIYVHPTTGRIYLVGRTASTTFPNTLGRAFGGPTFDINDNLGDAFVTCLEKDGTSLVWSTYIGGTGGDEAFAVSVDAAGDVYVAGVTNSSNFPVNGTTAAYDASLSGQADFFVLRLNSTGATLKYSTFIGNSGDDGNYTSTRLVETNGIVYYGGESGFNVGGGFPTTPGAYQTLSNGAVLFGMNTNVGGASGLVFSTYFGSSTAVTLFRDIIEDKDGNLWLLGEDRSGDPTTVPVSANAIQGPNPRIRHFIVKFSKSGQYLYSSYVYPFSVSQFGYCGTLQLATDAQGNLYLTGGFGTAFDKASNITNFYNLSGWVPGSATGAFVAKIPYDLSPQYDFVTVVSLGGQGNNIDVDKKGNIHLTVSNAGPLTAGNLNISGGLYYCVLSPSGGSVLYGTGVTSGTVTSYRQLLSVNDKCEAYVATNFLGAGTTPITPTYRDFETNTQKSVYNISNTSSVLSVFHEPIPNNSIPNFAPGNNTFCVNGAIWQNPNDGPIIGNTPLYTSGDGSLPTHNIPNTVFGAHPIPASPVLQYQWQKSLDGGTNWINVGNGTFDVYKPEPEPAAGTVQYRRTVVGFCCNDTVSISNAISATIAGNFNLQITTPTKPVYYCPTVAGTSLGVSVTGASGNISWQWYDGFSPLTGSGIISPSSGSGTEASFTAAVGTSVSTSGFYRLVITDAGGCKKEAFVSIAPKTASAWSSPTVALCPGAVISITIGPPAVNPDFDYSWTGPSGFTSTNPNPTVTVAGTYTLKVKLPTDATFCNPGTSVTVTAATAHPAVLTNLSNKTFCQDDTPAAIGLSGTAPTGYVFQWVPGTNLDDDHAFNPIYDPGTVPGGPPASVINYTFSALRLSDGCIFERTNTVTNTALAFAFAGSDRIGDGCTTGTLNNIGGATETTGLYFQWTAVGTNFAAGLAALKANAAFGMDVLGQQIGTNELLNAKFPLCSANGNVGYYIDYELKASYIPFSNTCFTADVVRVFVPCCGISPACPVFSSNFQGATGACSGATSQLSLTPIGGATYVWTTYSVNGVVQPANTPPRGIFVNNSGVKGAAISGAGPHPTSVIVDFDDATWGWLGNNVVVYEVTQTIDVGNGPISCFSRQQVFSGLVSTPLIGVIDLSICSIPLPGVRVGTAGIAGPYTLTGANYTQAPNSAFNWTWTAANGAAAVGITGGGTTPFPTFNPSSTTPYRVTVRDAATGCIAKDTLVVTVKPVIANAGPDLTGICPGTVVQLGTPAQPDLSYTWSPVTGLNFPIGTPNNLVAQPYLSVPAAPPATLTYTVSVTDATTGCQARDNMTIGISSTPPPAIAAASYNNCADGVLTIGPAGSLAGVTYAWTVQSGTADLAWLSSTSERNPTVTLPSNFSGPAVFRLTVTKGTCGSVFADYTITDTYPAINLGGPYTASCTSPFTQIGETALSGYTYTWLPYTGLYSNSTLTTAYLGENLSSVWVRPTATTTYTLIRKNDANGCEQSATVVVNPPAGVAVDAGGDQAWCPGAPAIPIGAAGSGTLTWTARGYTANLLAAPPTTIASPMTSGQMLGYLSGTSGAVVNFMQSTVVSGQYVYRLTSTNGGCTLFDEVVVRVSPAVTGIAGLSQNVCLGESVQIGASTNPNTLNYLWTALSPSNAGNTISDPTAARPFVTPTVNTVYQVTYINPTTGCSADEQVPVVVNPSPTINISQPVVCVSAGTQNLTSYVTNYASLMNPVWYKTLYPGGVVVATPTAETVNQTTTYFVVAQSSLGCEGTAQITLTIGACCPIINNPSVAQALCAGDAGSAITAETDQNTANSIRFVRFSTDQTANNAAPTAGELAAIYTGGTALATVTPAGAAAPYTATLSAATAGWSALAPGTYYVYVIVNPDPGATCRPVQEIIVTIAPAATVTAGGPDNACQSATPSAITLSGASVGGGATTGAWSIISGGGTLSSTAQTATPGTVTYTPAANFTGTVTLRLTTNDPTGACPAVTADRTIMVDVCACPAPPSVVITETNVDVCGIAVATFNYTVSNGPATITTSNGTLANFSTTTLNNGTGTFTYTPAAGEIGMTINVTATIADPDGGVGDCMASMDNATVTVGTPATVTVGGPDNVCQSATPSAITLSGASVGGGATTGAWSIISGGGTLSSTAQTATPETVTYTPAANFTGTVTLRLTTNDPTGACPAVTADRIITVDPAATVTAGGPDNVCQSATPSAITLSGASVGGGATTGAWSIISGGGTLSSTAQTATPETVTYTPAANFTGTVTLRLTTNDPTGACPAVTADRIITVDPAATVTAGGPDNACQSATPSAITLSGASVGGGATTGAWSIISGGGTLSSTAQTATPETVTYTPAANFTGTVTLRLTTNDPTGACPAVTADRIITVDPAATVTAGGPDNACQSATPSAITLSGASVGGGATTGAWSIISGGGTLSSTAQTATPETVTYTPAANFTGTVTLRLTTNDPTGACPAVTADRTITVDPAATVTAGGPDNACQSATPSAITLSGASVGGSATTGAWSIISGGGTLSSTAQTATPETVTYTPAANFTGTVTLRLTTNDPTGACPAVTADRTITVDPAATVTAGGPDNACQSATPSAITLSGASVGGGATTGAWSIISGGGTLSSTAQTATPETVTYTPAANFTGTVTLRLTTNDPTGACPAVTADRTLMVDVCVPPCALTAITFANSSICNNNGTNMSAVDDYFTADITVTFSNPPATGNLVLTGDVLVGGGATTVTVATAGAGPTYTFVGVRLRADGTSSAVTATFSADNTCTFGVTNGPNVPSCSNCVVPVLATTNGTVCIGNSISLVTLVTGNSPAGTLTFYTSQSDANAATNVLVNSTVAPVANTTYYVRSETGLNCFATALVSVTVAANPAPTVTNGSVCSGGSINLATLVTSTGGGTLSFYTSQANANAGTNALGSSTVSPTTATNYYVRSTAAGCYGVKEITVTIAPAACGNIIITGPN